LFSYFESRIDPYPEAPPQRAPKGMVDFFWQITKGSRWYFVAILALTGGIAAFEAVLFAFLGQLVDWLSTVKPENLWSQKGGEIATLAAVLCGSILLVGFQALVKYQTLYGSFPMRLRWNFHRWMLSQSMSFYQDEFAGRVAAKVMQTALASRDVLITITDIAIYVIIYFATMTGLMGSFDLILFVPFIAWVCLYGLAMKYFVPRIGEIGKLQADARSLMMGRITDAYSNISTVKLFSHSDREAHYARDSMREFMDTVKPQMRLSSSFEIVNHCLSILLILGTCGLVLWLWSQGRVGIGAVAASCAMAMRLNGISHWVMWELAGLFENIGTVRDGINMLNKPISVVDVPNAKPLEVSKGEIRFDNVTFGYAADSPVLHQLNLTIQPGERIGLVGPSGAGKSTLTNLLLHFYDVQQGRVLIDQQDVAKVQMQSLQAHIGMVTQDISLLHRSLRENLAYGRPDANQSEIEAAAARAEAAEFIANLEDGSGRKGYDAHVGERGVKL
jgi:ATP-binding cassette, subfamily B, multidrug efflux pump